MQRLLHLLKRIRDKDKTFAWKLVYDRFSPAQESLREVLCALGNGYFCTRAAAPESPTHSRVHYPGTYMAGVYNRLATHIAGRSIFNEDLVNCPNWLFLTFRIGESEWVSPATNNLFSYYQELDLRSGVLFRKVRLRNRRRQRTTVQTQRIVHMAKPHLAAIRYVICPENYRGWIVIRSGLDGTVQNTGVVRYRQLNSRHLKARSSGAFGKEGIFLSVESNQSKIKISQAAGMRIFAEGKQLKPVSRIVKKGKKAIYQDFRIFVHKGKHYEIEKIVSVYTSKDKGIENTLTACVKSVKSAGRFNDLLKTHRRAWNQLWKRFDIQIEGDVFSQKALRLHIFHLLQSACIYNARIDAGLAARGLHGEAYRGHIFWDNLFVMPFYNLHIPQISQALLLYRYRRLARARRNAREGGYQGAMFPWQSGSSGKEETPLVHLNPVSGKWGLDLSRIQRHISFAVAYNVWQYWQTTGDLDFLIRYGAEMILSIAQFGASLARYSPRDKRYHTEGLMGPDEFHEKYVHAAACGLKDNAYTNLLIVWTLLKAQEVLAVLPDNQKERLLGKLGLGRKDLRLWQEITRKMNIVISADGIVSQFDGYFKLKEVDWRSYRARYGKIQRMDRILKAEGKSPNEYKVAKQADTLMIFYLLPLPEVKDLLQRLGYHFDNHLLKKNFDYYIQRTSHGSTLSKVVYCYIMYVLGKANDGWKLFLEILKSDIYDTQGGTTPEGIHTGVMGSSINIAMQMLAGIEIEQDKIRLKPHLPKKWRSVKMKFYFKKRWIDYTVTHHQVRILIHGLKAKSFSTPFQIDGKLHYFQLGKPHKISFKKHNS